MANAGPHLVELLLDVEGGPPTRVQLRPRGPTIVALRATPRLVGVPPRPSGPASLGASTLACALRAALVGAPDVPHAPGLLRLQIRAERGADAFVMLDDRRAARRALMLVAGSEEVRLDGRPGALVDVGALRAMGEHTARFFGAPSATALRGDLAVLERAAGAASSPKRLALQRAHERHAKLEAERARLDALTTQLDAPLRRLAAIGLGVAASIVVVGAVVPDGVRAPLIGPLSGVALVGLGVEAVRIALTRRAGAREAAGREAVDRQLDAARVELDDLLRTFAKKGEDADAIAGAAAPHALDDDVPAIIALDTPSSGRVAPLRGQPRQVVILVDAPRATLDPSLADLVVEPT